MGLKTLEVNCPAKCPLLPKRRIVQGSGSPHAKVAFVGEAPGYDEHRSGVPFIGPAGSVLMDVLDTVGLLRDCVYITNTVKCFPRDYNDKKMTPTKRVIKLCATAHLLPELRSLPDLRLVVLLGQVARKQFYEVKGGMKSELRMLNLGEGKKVWSYSMLHPAAVLHNPMASGQFEKDTEKLRKLLENKL